MYNEDERPGGRLARAPPDTEVRRYGGCAAAPKRRWRPPFAARLLTLDDRRGIRAQFYRGVPSRRWVMSAGRGFFTSVVLFTLLPAALADQYWIAYEADNGRFPEEEGWVRSTGYGGDLRWFEDGWLVMDGMADPRIWDTYRREMHGTLDPNPGEVLLIQWRLETLTLIGPYDPAVSVFSDLKWAVGFHLSRSAIHSSFESGVSASFQPGVCHDFEFRSADMRRYVLCIDGVPRIYGDFWLSLTPSKVAWGDGVYNAASLARWDYLRFGVLKLGDLNCDGRIDFQDINPFVLAVIDPAGYEQVYPRCSRNLADCNVDGYVDFSDINPFVQLLIGQADGSAA
ncbi:MAG: hypothetical protein AB1716_10285 [Planctomycetota bacterium]